jgi:mannose-6-phosphate isomerase-like protein (cupin superfamily)
MTGTEALPLDASHILRDDRVGGTTQKYEQRQKRRTKGWQVASIRDNIEVQPPGHSYIKLTNNRYADVALNVYRPGQRDEMHCHPGSEHIFLVFQGELHIRGLDPDEDVVLRPGELVHINQSYYYQLANETDDITVLYQVATKPAKPPKISRYSYRGPQDVDPRTLEGG